MKNETLEKEQAELAINWIERLGEDLPKMVDYKKEIDTFVRDLLKLIIWLSAWVVGFSVPIFKDASIIQCLFLFKCALFLCIVSIISGILFFYKSIKDKNSDYEKWVKQIFKREKQIYDYELRQIEMTEEEKNKEWEEFIKRMWTGVKAYLEEVWESVKKSEAWNRFWHVSCRTFVSAIILLFVSLI